MADLKALKNQEAWDDMMSASKEISKLWKGVSVVEEIKQARREIKTKFVTHEEMMKKFAK